MMFLRPQRFLFTIPIFNHKQLPGKICRWIDTDTGSAAVTSGAHSVKDKIYNEISFKVGYTWATG